MTPDGAGSLQPALMRLIRTIAAGDSEGAARQLAEVPALATISVEVAATREAATDYFLDEIVHYVYAGDTALHIAAASYQLATVQALLGAGANVRAKNRRGAEPLHYAADGHPDSLSWNPPAQQATIACLLAAGADPNATDKGGVAPLHRAVRTRCAAAVKALLDGGADIHQKNNNGSTAMDLAVQTTGRGGSGGAAAKAQQQDIIDLLRERTRS